MEELWDYRHIKEKDVFTIKLSNEEEFTVIRDNKTDQEVADEFNEKLNGTTFFVTVGKQGDLIVTKK